MVDFEVGGGVRVDLGADSGLVIAAIAAAVEVEGGSALRVALSAER